ncbi:hypothetical protein [Sagittula sp. SSi028]|uniref:hypothetical protein n=1 Tax=Sagittula sp. SSi028 TaxID=3400636 RepID=UPI003AF989BB
MFHLAKAIGEWQAVAWAGSRLWLSAGAVVQARTMQMALGVMQPQEFTRMVMEKPSAFARSGEMAMRAMAGNKGYAVTLSEALKPIEASASANARRLQERPKRKGSKARRR